MLITSKFHDYYDTIKSFGVDKTVVYNRKQEIITFKKGPRMYSSGLWNGEKLRATRIIGFCGKLYPLFEKEGSKLIYDMDVALKQVKDFSWYHKEVIANFTEDLNNPELLKIFTEKKVPIFIYGDYLDGKRIHGNNPQLILNPKLENWGFQSVVDPVTAFQSIYMYISGVIGVSAAPMVKLSDKELAKKRGHGDKYSFRKMSGDKKRKKK